MYIYIERERGGSYGVLRFVGSVLPCNRAFWHPLKGCDEVAGGRIWMMMTMMMTTTMMMMRRRRRKRASKRRTRIMMRRRRRRRRRKGWRSNGVR